MLFRSLEAIYPSETVPELDYSVCLSDADWITPAEKSAAILFQKYLTSQNVQVAAQQMGFRAVQYVSDSIDSFTSALGAETQPDEVAVPLSSTQINKFFSIQDLLSPKTATMYVIDCSGSMQNDPLANAKRLVRAALEIEREGDLKGLISFSSTPQLISAPISNTHTLLPYLAGLEANGGSSIYDSILLGAEVLRKPEFSKVQRHLVLITDGNDQNSKTNLAFFSNAFQRRAGTQGLTLSIFHIENSEADVSDLKQISDLLNGTLHSLSPSITSEEFLKKIAQG